VGMRAGGHMVPGTGWRSSVSDRAYSATVSTGGSCVGSAGSVLLKVFDGSFSCGRDSLRCKLSSSVKRVASRFSRRGIESRHGTVK
jgi:hypothetical protein